MPAAHAKTCRRRPLRWSLLVPGLLPALAAGCGAPDLADRVAAYHEQIVEALGERAAPTERASRSLPPRRDRRLAVADHRMGGFDFLTLQGCRLAQHVGLRNSPLGKVMVPSQQLIYELGVLDAADECLVGLEASPAERLRALVAAKRSELTAHIWNALWTSEEMETYLSPAARPIGRVAHPDDRAGLLAALAVLRRPIRTAADGEALERALEKLRGEFPAGAMLGSLDRVRQHLDAVATVLASRSPAACSTEELRLARIFETKYLPLQSDVAVLDRRVHDRLEVLSALFGESSTMLPAPPEAMLRYGREQLSPESSEGAWQRYRRALTRHVHAWQPTLSLCGRLPEVETS
jgi:hypothetical protein